MVTVLKKKREPSLSEKFGNAFAAGGQQFAQSLGELKESPKKSLLPNVKSVLGISKLQTSDDEAYKVYLRANEYRDKGADDDMAAFMAVEDLNKGKLHNYKTPGSKENIVSELSKGDSPEMEKIKPEEKEHHQGLKNWDPVKRPIETLEYEDLFQLSNEQLESLPRSQKKEYLDRIKELGPGAVGSGLLSGATLGLSNRLTKSIAPQFSNESLTKEGAGLAVQGGELVGSLIPLGAGFKIANWFHKGKTPLVRAIQAGSVFGTEKALKDAFDKGEVNPGDIGIAALSGGAFQFGLEKIIPWVKNLVPKVKGSFPKGVKHSKIKENLLLDFAVKEAAAEGVSIEALQKGDPESIQKFTQTLENINKLPPSVLSEKINRLYGESNLKNLTRRAEVIEDQINYSKKTRRLSQEIAEEEGRIAERDKPVKKRDSTIAKENALKMDAEKELPSAVKRYTSASKSLGEAKDNFNFMKKNHAPIEYLEKSKNNIDRLSELVEESHESVKALNYQKNLGKPYRSVREQEIEAINDIENLEHKVNTRPESEIFKPDSRQEYVEKIKGRREIPGTEMLKPDTQSRIRNVRIKEYENKIKQLKQKKMVTPLENRGKIDKAIDIAEKLLQQNKEYLKVHERRRALQDISKTLKRQEKIKNSELIKEDKRVREIVQKAIKEPSIENVDKAHESLYGKEESKKIDESIDEIIFKADEIQSGKGSEFQKEQEFAKAFKEKINESKTKFQSEKPKPGDKEQQKAYLNYLKLILKLAKAIPKLYNQIYKGGKGIRRAIITISSISGLLGFGGITPNRIWKYIENRSEAKKFSKLQPHEKRIQKGELKKKYSAARIKQIEELSKSF